MGPCPRTARSWAGRASESTPGRSSAWEALRDGGARIASPRRARVIGSHALPVPPSGRQSPGPRSPRSCSAVGLPWVPGCRRLRPSDDRHPGG